MKRLGLIYWFTWQLRQMETNGASGGPDHAGFDSRSIFDGALAEE
jgi:hypothetical protein